MYLRIGVFGISTALSKGSFFGAKSEDPKLLVPTKENNDSFWNTSTLSWIRLVQF